MFARIIFVLLLFFSVVPRSALAGNILVMGDSLSAAFSIDVDKGWVNLLHQRLKSDEKFKTWEIVNASISGETTVGGLARLPKLLQDYQPQLCVLQLGANDGLRGQSIKRMRQNLEAMIQQCQTIGANVMLLGILLPPNYGKQYTDAFQAVYPQLVEKYDIEWWLPFLLEGVATNPELMLADGLHPNIKGQPRVLENVWPVFKTALLAMHATTRAKARLE